MKDWENLEADVNRLLTKHYTKGRGGHNVEFVVVHYNAGNLTINGCYSVWQAREASAHYQVEDDGDIGQLVWDGNTAWHAGDWVANCKSIGIEHANLKDGTITEAALDNGAHLVAAVCKYYGLGRPTWLNVVFPHKYFSATSCPGQIYGSQKDAYIKRAQYWYDKMTGADVPDEPEVEEPILEVDGLWGRRRPCASSRPSEHPSRTASSVARTSAGRDPAPAAPTAGNGSRAGSARGRRPWRCSRRRSARSPTASSARRPSTS